MNRLLLSSVPVVESELYKRRSTRLISLYRIPNRRATTLAHIHKRNIAYNQKGISDANYTIPVHRELFKTSNVRHQATRKRLLSVYKPEMVETDEITILA
jgi:hypothetical protein